MLLLKVEDLHVTLSGLHIIQGVSIEAKAGELVVMVGTNGAGKSTFLRAICGLNPYQSGKIMFDNADITNQPVYGMVMRGLCMVPEGRQLFPELSAKDNLLMGAYYYKKDKAKIEKNLQWVYSLFPVLKKHEKRIASTFSGGEQQMLSIGRGLMSEPKLIMIDELSLGLAPKIIEMLFSIIKELNRQSISILLVEQNARQALKIADKAYVMETGKIVLEGSGKELLDNKHVKTAYLGL